MSLWLLYFLVKLDSLISVFEYAIIIAITSVIFISVMYVVNAVFIAENYNTHYSERPNLFKANTNKFFRRMKIAIIAFFILTLLKSIIPTTKEMAFIYIVGNVSQSETAKKIGEEATKVPEKALQLLNYKLDEYMKQFEKTTQ